MWWLEQFPVVCARAFQHQLNHEIIETTCQCIWNSKMLLKTIHLRAFVCIRLDLVCGEVIRVFMCSCVSTNQQHEPKDDMLINMQSIVVASS